MQKLSRETIINLALLALFPILIWTAQLAGHNFFMTLGARIAILALAATGLNLALGLGGMVSFGHAAFFGIGGYVAGIMASHAGSGEAIFGLFEASRQMPIVWIIALLAGGLIALPIGIISLRTSGVYFIMITLAFAQMLFYFAISWPSYGGEDGLSLPLRNAFPGFNSMRPMVFFLITYGVFLVAVIFFAVLRNSRFGSVLEATRQNATRVASVGISPYKIKLVAFVLSAMVTALAGALYADLNRFVSPSMLSWHLSGELIVLIVLGGTGRLLGPLLGATAYVLLEHYLGGITERWQFFLGLILLSVVLFARGGLMSIIAGKQRYG